MNEYPSIFNYLYIFKNRGQTLYALPTKSLAIYVLIIPFQIHHPPSFTKRVLILISTNLSVYTIS